MKRCTRATSYGRRKYVRVTGKSRNGSQHVHDIRVEKYVSRPPRLRERYKKRRCFQINVLPASVRNLITSCSSQKQEQDCFGRNLVFVLCECLNQPFG